MAEEQDVQVNISGFVPAKSGKDPQFGNWVLIDKSGDFSFDRTVTATIWLVGGGCDGTAGEWLWYPVNVDGHRKWDIAESGYTGTSYAGNGGDGGYVFTAMNVKIPKNTNCSAVIAEANDKSGTSLYVKEKTYRCDEIGHMANKGGSPGGVNSDDTLIQPSDGKNGILTPYGYVGSSGGGGLGCDGFNNITRTGKGGEGAGSTVEHRKPGTDAENYGCGGGGGAVCGQIGQGQEGGKGMQGCIIIAYTPAQNTLVVQKHYKRVCNTHKTCDTDYYSNSSHKTCCGNSGGCGCGSSKSINASDYIDTIHIRK